MQSFALKQASLCVSRRDVAQFLPPVDSSPIGRAETMSNRKPLGKDAATRPVGKPRGRNGGRKPDAATARSKEVANLIAEGKRYILDGGQPLPKDATPLDVMLAAMRAAYDRAGPEVASQFAAMAAPYLHAKIAQMELRGNRDQPVQITFAWAGDTNGI